MSNSAKNERFLRLDEVTDRTGLSRSSLYQSMSEGKFPQNKKIGSHSVGWLETEIDAWMQDRINQRSTIS